MDEDKIDISKAEIFEHPKLPEWWKSDRLWHYLEIHYNIRRDGIIDDADLPLICIVSRGIRLEEWK